jgi:hypothetical protein
VASSSYGRVARCSRSAGVKLGDNRARCKTVAARAVNRLIASGAASALGNSPSDRLRAWRASCGSRQTASPSRGGRAPAEIKTQRAPSLRSDRLDEINARPPAGSGRYEKRPSVPVTHGFLASRARAGADARARTRPRMSRPRDPISAASSTRWLICIRNCLSGP